MQQIWHPVLTRPHADLGLEARQFRVAIKVSVRISDPRRSTHDRPPNAASLLAIRPALAADRQIAGRAAFRSGISNVRKAFIDVGLPGVCLSPTSRCR